MRLSIRAKLGPESESKFPWSRKRVGLGGGGSARRPPTAAEVLPVSALTPSSVPELGGYCGEAPLRKSEKCEDKPFSVPKAMSGTSRLQLRDTR